MHDCLRTRTLFHTTSTLLLAPARQLVGASMMGGPSACFASTVGLASGDVAGDPCNAVDGRDGSPSCRNHYSGEAPSLAEFAMIKDESLRWHIFDAVDSKSGVEYGDKDAWKSVSPPPLPPPSAVRRRADVMRLLVFIAGAYISSYLIMH